MRFKLLGAAFLAAAFAMVGMPAANANSTYALCLNNDRAYCVNAAAHGDMYWITNYAAVAHISFINEYTTSNGNNWWELTTGGGLCLNWNPRDHYVYSDSCIAGDANELWYNHVAGQLINLAGNLDTGHDTYLNFGTCLYQGSGFYACPLIATNTPYGGWVELPY
jgi:hypothetical protein